MRPTAPATMPPTTAPATMPPTTAVAAEPTWSATPPRRRRPPPVPPQRERFAATPTPAGARLTSSHRRPPRPSDRRRCRGPAPRRRPRAPRRATCRHHPLDRGPRERRRRRRAEWNVIGPALPWARGRARPQQCDRQWPPRRAAAGVRARVRLRPGHVAARRTRLHGHASRRPLRSRGCRRIRPLGVGSGPVPAARGLRRRRHRDRRCPGPAPRRLRRPLGQRDDRRSRRRRAAGPLRAPGPRRAQPSLRRRR